MPRKYMIFRADTLNALIEKDRVKAILLHELNRYSPVQTAVSLYLAEYLPRKIAKDPEWSRDHAIIHRCVDDFHNEDYWNFQGTN